MRREVVIPERRVTRAEQIMAAMCALAALVAFLGAAYFRLERVIYEHHEAVRDASMANETIRANKLEEMHRELRGLSNAVQGILDAEIDQ